MGIKFNLQEKQVAMKKAAEEFSNGKPIAEVMKKYAVSYASIYNAIRRYKIPYHYTWGRSVFFNESFFEIIDNEEKAYWLGFIFADGSVIKTDKKMREYNRLSIALSIQDRAHLEKFVTAIDYPIDKIHVAKQHGFNADSEICYVRCNSIKMAQDLISHKCLPNKTYKRCFPSYFDVPEYLMRHFIRGYFDGDGSICQITKTKSWIFSITTEYYTCECIQKILMENCDLNKTKIIFNKNAGTLRYGGRLQVTRIFHYLYDDANIYLNRKYDKFRAVVFTADKTISSSPKTESLALPV